MTPPRWECREALRAILNVLERNSYSSLREARILAGRALESTGESAPERELLARTLGYRDVAELVELSDVVLRNIKEGRRR